MAGRREVNSTVPHTTRTTAIWTAGRLCRLRKRGGDDIEGAVSAVVQPVFPDTVQPAMGRTP